MIFSPHTNYDKPTRVYLDKLYRHGYTHAINFRPGNSVRKLASYYRIVLINDDESKNY